MTMAITRDEESLASGLRIGRVQRWNFNAATYFLDLATGRTFRSSRPSDSLMAVMSPVSAGLHQLVSNVAPQLAWSPNPDIPGWQLLAPPAVPVFFHRGRLVVGPAIRRYACPCSTCVLIRLLGSTPWAKPLAALWSREPALTCETWLTDQVMSVRERLPDQLNQIQSSAIPIMRSMDLVTKLWITHTVRALPGAPRHSLTTYSMSLGLQ